MRYLLALTRALQYFFSGEHANDLTTVQYVYLAVALMGVAVATAFVFTPLPEVSEAALQAEAEALADATEAEVVDRGFWRTRAPFGAITQFMYVGAQVTIGTFFINYAHENGGLATSEASQFLSYGLILFTVGRFVGTALLAVISAPLLLSVYAVICCVLIALIATLHGMSGVACTMIIMFFESVMYPVIFVTGTSGLGRHTRRGAGLLVMGEYLRFWPEHFDAFSLTLNICFSLQVSPAEPSSPLFRPPSLIRSTPELHSGSACPLLLKLPCSVSGLGTRTAESSAPPRPLPGVSRMKRNTLPRSWASGATRRRMTRLISSRRSLTFKFRIKICISSRILHP